MVMGLIRLLWAPSSILGLMALQSQKHISCRKLKLINLSDEQITHRVTQLNWRLNESKESAISSCTDFTSQTVTTPQPAIYESRSSSSAINIKSSINRDNYKDFAVYYIGVEDNGYPVGISKIELHESVKTLFKIATAANGELVIKSILKGYGGCRLNTITKPEKMNQFVHLNDNNYVAQILVTRTHKKHISSSSQLTVAVAGDFDSGKSTLIGVLSTGQSDNGKGSARMHIFQHNHELSSGRTSSIAQHNIYFDSQGTVLNNSVNRPYSNNSKSNLLSKLSESEMTDRARCVTYK